jgi:hypothetical protein
LPRCGLEDRCHSWGFFSAPASGVVCQLLPTGEHVALAATRSHALRTTRPNASRRCAHRHTFRGLAVPEGTPRLFRGGNSRRRGLLRVRGAEWRKPLRRRCRPHPPRPPGRPDPLRLRITGKPALRCHGLRQLHLLANQMAETESLRPVFRSPTRSLVGRVTSDPDPPLGACTCIGETPQASPDT